MRIYKITTEHEDYGRNFSTFNLDAKDFVDVLKKTQKKMRGHDFLNERIESIELIASTD